MTENQQDYEILPDGVGNSNFSFKIIVIGDSAVGKSSLTLRAIKDQYKDFYSPTIGFEFISFNVKIKNQIVKLQIWDTCGQEIYRSLISSFYRNSSLAIIVYSIDNLESFENIDSWLDEIKSQTHPNLKIFLIGNKVDLEDKRVVTKKDAEELVKEHNIDLFFETSAKTGLNTQEIFVKAAEILLENYKKYEIDERVSSATGKTSITITRENESEIGRQEEDVKRRKKCC